MRSTRCYYGEVRIGIPRGDITVRVLELLMLIETFAGIPSAGNICRPSGTWAMPSRTRLAAESLRMLVPSNRMSPPLNGRTPEMMRISGYQVVKFLNSTPAMRALVYEKPDVVLLDVMMPDASGLDVLGFIRREPALSGLPVIVVSAKSLPSDIKTGIEAGASIYLTKPVSFLDLKRTVEQILEGDSTHQS